MCLPLRLESLASQRSIPSGGNFWCIRPLWSIHCLLRQQKYLQLCSKTISHNRWSKTPVGDNNLYWESHFPEIYTFWILCFTKCIENWNPWILMKPHDSFNVKIYELFLFNVDLYAYCIIYYQPNLIYMYIIYIGIHALNHLALFWHFISDIIRLRIYYQDLVPS